MVKGQAKPEQGKLAFQPKAFEQFPVGPSTADMVILTQSACTILPLQPSVHGWDGNDNLVVVLTEHTFFHRTVE